MSISTASVLLSIPSIPTSRIPCLPRRLFSFDHPPLCLRYSQLTPPSPLFGSFKRCTDYTAAAFPNLKEILVPVMTAKEQELIFRIDDELARLEVGSGVGGESLLQALKLVDLIERLGIQRYFQHPIAKILSSTHMQWNDKLGLNEAGITVLAFRLLRLHGFHVSADVLKALMNGDQGFGAYFSVTTPTGISNMLNLYRCSQVGFPCESIIMREANKFARYQLEKSLSNGDECVLQTNNLGIEMVFALEFSRQYLLPRLESRSIIGQLWSQDGSIMQYLMLAKLDLLRLQKQHQQELDILDKWWIQNSFDKVECARTNHVKCYFGVAPTLFEPQYSTYRLAFSITACFCAMVDDIFDSNGDTIIELRHFAKALNRWDPTLVNDIPQHKLVLTTLCNTTSQMAAEASRIQNHDLLPLFMDLWDSFVASLLTEAEWTNSRHIPTFEEYMRVAHYSSSSVLLTWTSIFFLGEVITEEMSTHIGIDSRFMYLLGVVFRLSNDLAGHERESREGKVATAINCYRSENPRLNQEEVIASIEGMLELSCEELELELFHSMAVVPECCRRAVISLARSACYIQKVDDGFNSTNSDYRKVFKDYLYGSLD